MIGRLPTYLHELDEDTLENQGLAMLGQDQAQETIRKIDRIAHRLISAAEDCLMTPDELVECLRGLAEVRRSALAHLDIEVKDEAVGRRICVNTQTAIRQREPLRKATLTRQVRV